MTQTHGLSIQRIVGYTAVVVATLAMLFVLYRLRQVVLLFVLSIVVAAALRKGVLALENRHVPRSLAILFWYAVIVSVIAVGLYFLGAALRQEVQQIAEQLPMAYDAQLSHYRQHGQDWQKSLAARLPDTETFIQGLGAEEAAEMAFQIAGLTSGIASILISLGAILGFALYWLIDQDHFERLWLTLLPVHQRAIARHTWHEIEHRVGAYVRSEAAQFVLTIAVLWLAFRLLGLPYPTLYALYAGVVQLIPWIGVPLTLLPLLLMIFGEPWWLILAAAGVIVVVGVMMDRVLEPWLCGDAVVHPILTVLALMIMGEASGVMGMIIALPLAATLQIVLSEIMLFNTSPRAVAVAMEATQIQELRTRIDRLREELPQDAEQRREAEGLLARVQNLMNRTEEVLRQSGAEEQVRRGRRAGRVSMVQRAKPS